MHSMINRRVKHVQVVGPGVVAHSSSRVLENRDDPQDRVLLSLVDKRRVPNPSPDDQFLPQEIGVLVGYSDEEKRHIRACLCQYGAVEQDAGYWEVTSQKRLNAYMPLAQASVFTERREKELALAKQCEDRKDYVGQDDHKTSAEEYRQKANELSAEHRKIMASAKKPVRFSQETADDNSLVAAMG